MPKLPPHFHANCAPDPEPNGSIPCYYLEGASPILVVVLACPCNDGNVRSVYIRDPSPLGEDAPNGIPSLYWSGFVRVFGRIVRNDEGYSFVTEGAEG